MDSNVFGKNLRRARRARGWSFDRLAQEIDRRKPEGAKATSKSYLHGLEAGTKPNPSKEYVVFLASALGCQPADLWDDASDFEREAVELIRRLPKDSRDAALRMLRGLAMEKAG